MTKFIFTSQVFDYFIKIRGRYFGCRFSRTREDHQSEGVLQLCNGPRWRYFAVAMCLLCLFPRWRVSREHCFGFRIELPAILAFLDSHCQCSRLLTIRKRTHFHQDHYLIISPTVAHALSALEKRNSEGFLNCLSSRCCTTIWRRQKTCSHLR